MDWVKSAIFPDERVLWSGQLLSECTANGIWEDKSEPNYWEILQMNSFALFPCWALRLRWGRTLNACLWTGLGRNVEEVIYTNLPTNGQDEKRCYGGSADTLWGKRENKIRNKDKNFACKHQMKNPSWKKTSFEMHQCQWILYVVQRLDKSMNSK